MKIIKNEKPEVMKALDYNDGYCPCALRKEKDTKCMCKNFREKINSGYIGECNCGLYSVVPNIIYLCGDPTYKEDFLNWNSKYSIRGYLVLMPPFLGKQPENIPEKYIHELESIHQQKMYAAEEIFVIDKYGKIDDKLQKDLEKMKRMGKIITYASEI